MTVKVRAFLEVAIYHICYRRIERINGLIIDGNAYADIEIPAETARLLQTRLDGHLFRAEYDGCRSYLPRTVYGLQVSFAYFEAEGNIFLSLLMS